MSSFFLPNQSLQNQPSVLSRLFARSNHDDLSSALSLQLPSRTNHHHNNRSPSASLPRDLETEELVMSDFQNLTIDEQADALNDIYAAGSELKENPAMIDKLLRNFEQQVGRGQYAIYDLALDQDSSYIEDPSFRLYFLRANMHDVKKAVKQMISFLYQKAKYFGVDKVGRDITLDDLTSNDLKLLLSGLYHIQDGTDRNGRVIFYATSSSLAKDVDSQIRARYFICFNILIPMHSVQMKGVVAIHYDVVKSNNSNEERTTNPGLRAMKKYADFAASLPIRKSAFHLCIRQKPGGNTVRSAFLRFCLRALPKQMREKARVHQGSPVELQYHLSTYGIPQITFPIDSEGKLRGGVQNAWFYKYLEEEGGICNHVLPDAHQSNTDDSSWADDDSLLTLSSDEEAEVNGGGDDLMSLDSAGAADGQQDDAVDDIAPPAVPYTNQDVLLGRGHDVQNHPGNTAFRAFLSEHQEEYDDAPRLSKCTITRGLTRALLANGVRFWQKTEEDFWIETNFDDAEKKVGQVFRSARKRINNK